MHTGMMWLDTSQTTIENKVQKAVEYYEKKYGRKPDLVLVHPSMLENRPGVRSMTIGDVTIRPYRPVLPGHIWIGMEDKS